MCAPPLTQEAYDRAKKLLQAHANELHALAAALIERETLSGEQIKALLVGAWRSTGCRVLGSGHRALRECAAM